ncbi:hypothetical protein RRG08_026465 [Elysia crispata]|uniref:Uncharacterized protein n=1 Tax=Elysia crispata TaxID=231223 RepID=A0AAE0Y3W4_9GAST|nr:hypothetical protein RRG08_026465 [Elysia crispata]
MVTYRAWSETTGQTHRAEFSTDSGHRPWSLTERGPRPRVKHTKRNPQQIVVISHGHTQSVVLDHGSNTQSGILNR